MHTGILWISDKKDTLAVQIQKAVDYYTKKYGRTPNLCLVHPSMLEAAPDGVSFSSDGLTIRPYRPVLPGHIWIGVEDANLESEKPTR